MDYAFYNTLELRDKVIYLINLISTWKRLGVDSNVDIIRELKVNTNNDQEVMKILNLILPKIK